MASGTSWIKRLLPRQRTRWATTVAVAVVSSGAAIVAVPGTVSASPTGVAGAQAAAAGYPPCIKAATFATEIQWGGPDAPWHADSDLTLLVSNRLGVVSGDGVPVGTQVTWSGPEGNGSIVFFGAGDFSGAAQFPGEGPVGYRGTLRQPAQEKGAAATCTKAATFAAQIQWGGPDAAWHSDEDLSLIISNRRDVVGPGSIQNGTQVSWSGPNGKANITFFGTDFSGSAQFPDEGPVGYRGSLTASN